MHMIPGRAPHVEPGKLHINKNVTAICWLINTSKNTAQLYTHYL